MEAETRICFEEELNPQQLKVVKSGPGPILVIAGAGSGKTRTLTYRVAYLLDRGIDPYKILLLTFTNKAAREMVDRVEGIVPFEINKIWGGTFHHIGNRILRVHGERIGIGPGYTILDHADSHDLMNACLESLGHKRKDGVMPQGSVLHSIFSLARNTRTDLLEILERRYPFFLDYAEEIEKVALAYTVRKKSLNLIDFDDLLCHWLSLMEDHPEVKDYYTRRFEYVLVDEYQDTNRLQADIIDLLGSHHRNVMAVGDDSQSIYAFRGANFSNIMDFPKRYPDAQMYKLETNYRSSPEILDLANESIIYNEKQFQKTLRPIKGSGVQPTLILPLNVHQQAQAVAEKIRECIYEGTPPDEIAVLYRAHFHSMELQMELTRQSIGFEVRSGIRFFEQAHIKDIVSYLKILVNPSDEIAWKRILQLLPGIGKKTSQKICAHLLTASDPLGRCLEAGTQGMVPKRARSEWQGLCDTVGALKRAGPDGPPAAVLKSVLETGYREFMRSRYADSSGRSEDLDQFVEFSWQYESLADFLSELALMTGSETEGVEGREDPGRKIKLSTIHQAKGLEWSVVFIIWLVEGRFPNPNNFESLDDEAEERRLFYVAVTRAKDVLYLCAPVYSKDSSGYTSVMRPSRFLREIPETLYEKIEVRPGYGGGY